MANEKPSSALAAYVSASKTPRLSPEEEEELLRKGDDESRNRVVESNLALVVSIATAMGAKAFGDQGIMDIIQAGNEQLVKAARMYRPEEGTRFCTYATYWIRYGISREMSSQNSRLIHRPQEAYSLIGMISFLRDEMTQALGRLPIDDDIEAGLVGVACHDEIVDAMAASRGVLSLDVETDADDGPIATIGSTVASRSRMDVVDGSAVTEEAVAAAIVERITALLDPKQRLIVESIFGLGEHEGKPLTLDQTASLLVEKGFTDRPLTKERVRQLKEKALATMAADPLLRSLWEGGM